MVEAEGGEGVVEPVDHEHDCSVFWLCLFVIIIVDAAAAFIRYGCAELFVCYSYSG